MFGRKQRRIEELMRETDMLMAQIGRQYGDIDHLKATIRDYDGRLCAAMQQPTPQAIVEALRPLFLVAEARQRQHSDQLGMAMIENMKQDPDKCFGPPSQRALPNGL